LRSLELSGAMISFQDGSGTIAALAIWGKPGLRPTTNAPARKAAAILRICMLISLPLAAWISPIDKMLSMWGAADVDAAQSSSSAG